jgi:CheY-like chemotaxis protein
VFEVRGETVHVRADAIRVLQMIGNLLDNAAKAGARIVRMHASADASGGTLEVKDDGEGIPSELLPRLFDAFFQGPRQEPARPRGGLGLGLTLVNRLALLHGGALAAQSEGAGKGSTFTLRLPLAPVTDAVVRRLQRSPIGKLRILVIEDEEDVREGLRGVLETEGHEVAVAGDGPEGLALLERIGPDAAFIDIGLPGLDGLELARRARAGGSRALLVAISGYAAQRDRHGTSAAGFDFHLAKPPSAEDLKLVLSAAPRAA